MRHMINERTRMGVRQDLSPSSEASEPPQRLRSEISSGSALSPPRSLARPSPLGRPFVVFIVCLLTSNTFKHTKPQMVMTSLYFFLLSKQAAEQSINEQIGYNS